MKVYPTVTGVLCANSHPGSYTGQDAFNNMLPVIERTSHDLLDMPADCGICEWGGVSSTLAHRDYKDARDLVQEDNMEQDARKYVLRRLTPTECARLQGFPDWWCDGAEGSDSAQYKLWGNGIALPCAYDVLGRIAKAYRQEGTGQP